MQVYCDHMRFVAFLIWFQETIKNLEIVSNIRTGTAEHSLYGVVNHTKTSAGGNAYDFLLPLIKYSVAKLLITNLVQPPSG